MISRGGFQGSRGIARHSRIRRDVFGDNTAGPNNGVFADSDAAQQRCARTDGSAALNQRSLAIPIFFGLEFSQGARCSWVAIIDKRDPVSDEYLGLDGYAFANERMTRDLATSSDSRALLNLDKRADPCLVANLAAIKVDEGKDLDVATEPDVWRDSLIIWRLTVHRRTGSAAANLDSERANDGMISCG